jgi:hypothetical protein
VLAVGQRRIFGIAKPTLTRAGTLGFRLTVEHSRPASNDQAVEGRA